MFKQVLRNRNFVKILVASLIVGTIVGLMTYSSSLFSLNGRITDALYQYDNPSTVDDIYVIAIDERTMQEYGHPDYWDRSVYAELVDKLCSGPYKPAAITFDILFTGYRNEETDIQFAETCAKYGNVIVGACLDIESTNTSTVQNKLDIDVAAVRSITYPYPELNDAVETAIVNTEQDNDGIVRYALLTHSSDGVIYDSLATATYRRYCQYNNLPVKDYSEYARKKTHFTYSYEPATINKVSMVDILDGTRDNSIAAGEYEGKMMIVGAYGEGLQDAFMTPTDRKSQMYGVAIHSEIIRALETDALQLKPNRGQLIAVSIIYGFLSAAVLFVLYYCNLAVGGLISAVTIMLFTAACLILYRNGLYLPYIYPVIAIVLSYLAMIIILYLSIRLEKAKLNDAFKMYVSPQVVAEVSKSGTYEMKLGGQTKDIACLFIDIRGFTTMSEGLDPETVVGILNEYFAVVTDAVFKNGGTLDKFIGDAAMAVFNSPFDLDDYEMRAVRSAIDILAQTENLKTKIMERFGRTIDYGIGINCGPATIGNIGCSFRMDFTAIGDTVNTAARLESNAKAGQILISEEMYNRIKDRVEVEDVGCLMLTGKSKEIHTYNVLSAN